MAFGYNLRELLRSAPEIINKTLANPPPSGWGERLPNWKRNRIHRRGLLGWGEMRDKDGVVVRKKWAMPKVQRAALTKAISTWVDLIGLPPVRSGKHSHTHIHLTPTDLPHPPTRTGESLKKALKEGRIDLCDVPHPKKKPRGQTRGQMVLVPVQPPNDCDLRSVFVLVLAAIYCIELNLVDGTLATSAVLGYFNTTTVLNRILGNVRTKFEKLSNRKHLLTCAGVIHSWIHEGGTQATKNKIKLYRELGASLKDDDEKEMGYRLVELLVIISKGKGPDDDNKRGYYPFGSQGANSTMVFKSLPSSWFANCLTVLYPYIVKPKDQWDAQRKKYSHPMNSTGLWPQSTVKRYMSFYSLFRANRSKLFASYEDQEGNYHGPEPYSSQVMDDQSPMSQPLTQKDIDDMSDETEDSVDGDFL